MRPIGASGASRTSSLSGICGLCRGRTTFVVRAFLTQGIYEVCCFLLLGFTLHSYGAVFLEVLF